MGGGGVKRELQRRCVRGGEGVVEVLFLEIKTGRQMKDSQKKRRGEREGRGLIGRGAAPGLTNADIFPCCSPVVRSVKGLFRCLPRFGHES